MSENSDWMPATELREKLLAAKAKRRRHFAQAPIEEKLRVLEQMRELTNALKPVREANKARIRQLISGRAASAS